MGVANGWHRIVWGDHRNGTRSACLRDAEFVSIHHSIQSHAIAPGAYFIRAHAMDVEGFRLFDTVRREFTIRGESREFGLVRLPHVWQ